MLNVLSIFKKTSFNKHLTNSTLMHIKYDPLIQVLPTAKRRHFSKDIQRWKFSLLILFIYSLIVIYHTKINSSLLFQFFQFISKLSKFLVLSHKRREIMFNYPNEDSQNYSPRRGFYTIPVHFLFPFSPRIVLFLIPLSKAKNYADPHLSAFVWKYIICINTDIMKYYQ